MKLQGIYTLANDIVYDQLVALLNSIEVNVSPEIPICIIPYDERLTLVKQEVAARKNVMLYDNWEAINRWDKFAEEVWAVHPETRDNRKLSRTSLYKSPLLRKLAAFDGDFDKFGFYDADSLAMRPINYVFEKLDTYDFIFDDWEHGKSRDVAALNLSSIEKSGLYKEEQVRPKLHCSSFFVSKGGIFAPPELERLKKLLIEEGEIEWVSKWWDDAFLFSYLTLRSERPIFNFTLSPNGQDRTGNCANADPFVNVNNVLYNQQGLKPIHRLHYMGYAASDFARLCRGEDVNIRYQEEFLHYRFLHEPEKRPKKLTPPSLWSKTNQKMQKFANKIKRAIS
jgi:hypothetical protein